MKWLGATGAVLALGTAGFLTTNLTSADGAVLLTAGGAGSHVHCTITGTSKLSPPLADDWVQSQHSSDPSTNATFAAAIASIPDHTFSSGDVPVTTTSKSATGTCSDTHVVDQSNSSLQDDIKGASITTVGASDGTNESTCNNLANPPNPSGAKEILTSVIKWTGTAQKIAPTTVHAELSTFKDYGTGTGNTGVGFNLDANPTLLDTSITGSFSGGTTHSVAYIDTTTLINLALDQFGVHPTVGAPVVTLLGTDSVCQPSAQVKSAPATDLVSDSVVIKVKKPKGLKGISVTNSGPQAPLLALAGATITDTPSSIDFTP